MVLSTAKLLNTFCVVKTMNNDWLQRLQTLVARFSHLGIGDNIASLGLIELWAVYCYLSRLAGE